LAHAQEAKPTSSTIGTIHRQEVKIQTWGPKRREPNTDETRA